MRRHLLLGLALVALLPACRRQELASGISDSTFVRTVLALRRVPLVAGPDSGRRSAMRDSIMRAHHVTPAQLERAARELAAQPSHAQKVWMQIDTASMGATHGAAVTTAPAAVTPSVVPQPGAPAGTPQTMTPQQAAAPHPGMPPAAGAPVVPGTVPGRPPPKVIRMEATTGQSANQPPKR